MRDTTSIPDGSCRLNYKNLSKKEDFKKDVYSSWNYETSTKTQNSIFFIICPLMCVEQVRPKKERKNTRPHEKKFRGKCYLFKSKNTKNKENLHFVVYLVLYLDSLHQKVLGYQI